MASEVIPTDIAAKILGMNKQWMLDEMAAGNLKIGFVKKKDPKKRSGHGSYRVYRAKLAEHLGREPDHVWPEELE